MSPGLPGDDGPELEHDELLAVLESPAQLGSMARVADAIVNALDYLELLDVPHLSALHHWACRRRDEGAGSRHPVGQREAEVYAALANLIAWHTTQAPAPGAPRKRSRRRLLLNAAKLKPKRPPAPKRQPAGPAGAGE